MTLPSVTQPWLSDPRCRQVSDRQWGLPAASRNNTNCCPSNLVRTGSLPTLSAHSATYQRLINNGLSPVVIHLQQSLVLFLRGTGIVLIKINF